MIDIRFPPEAPYEPERHGNSSSTNGWPMTDKELLATRFVGWWCKRGITQVQGRFSLQEIEFVLGPDAVGPKGWYDIMCSLIEEWYRHRTLSAVKDPELRELIAAKKIELEMEQL